MSSKMLLDNGTLRRSFGHADKSCKFVFQRGKFRPRLIEFAESNEDATVQRTTSDAYGKLKKGQLRESVETLCKLKGIGPATASGLFQYKSI